jgi:hypothetical protein
MPLTPLFGVTQSASDNSRITITDSSTGSDGAISSRKIFIQLANGNYLTEDGEVAAATAINWSYADSSTAISVLPRSEAPAITVQWLNSGGTVLYSKTIKYCLNLADYMFLLGLTMQQVANNSITQDKDWYANKMQMIVNANDAENAIEYANDITLAQNALDRNYFLIQNESKFF